MSLLATLPSSSSSVSSLTSTISSAFALSQIFVGTAIAIPKSCGRWNKTINKIETARRISNKRGKRFGASGSSTVLVSFILTDPPGKIVWFLDFNKHQHYHNLLPNRLFNSQRRCSPCRKVRPARNRGDLDKMGISLSASKAIQCVSLTQPLHV